MGHARLLAPTCCAALTIALSAGVAPTAAVAKAQPKNDGRNSYTWILEGQRIDPAFAPRWNRCAPIRWAVDTHLMGAVGGNRSKEAARWRAVVAEAARVTGYTFIYKGRIDGQAFFDPAHPSDNGFRDINSNAYNAAGGIDVVITYAKGNSAGAYTYPAFQRGAWGFGGPSYGSAELVDGRTGGQQIGSGYAILRADKIQQAVKKKRTSTVRALYLHELGHVLGLGHVSDRRQIMYPSVGKVSHYAKGDQTGLKRLASAACFKPQPAQQTESFSADLNDGANAAGGVDDRRE